MPVIHCSDCRRQRIVPTGDREFNCFGCGAKNEVGANAGVTK